MMNVLTRIYRYNAHFHSQLSHLCIRLYIIIKTKPLDFTVNFYLNITKKMAYNIIIAFNNFDHNIIL
jgi:hypothetical protein